MKGQFGLQRLQTAHPGGGGVGGIVQIELKIEGSDLREKKNQREVQEIEGSNKQSWKQRVMSRNRVKNRGFGLKREVEEPKRSSRTERSSRTKENVQEQREIQTYLKTERFKFQTYLFKE